MLDTEKEESEEKEREKKQELYMEKVSNLKQKTEQYLFGENNGRRLGKYNLFGCDYLIA